jgi:hypothetical protein
MLGLMGSRSWSGSSPGDLKWGNASPEFKAGWWLTYPSEKHESQLGLFFPIYGKIKNGPNHQSVKD